MSVISLENCKNYFEQLNPQLIDWDFYSQYLDKEPPYGELGAVVFLRTYSRFIPLLGRREKFAEACLRVVEYSLSLDEISSIESKKEEAQLLFDCLFNFRGFASGRAYWIAGTEQTKNDGSASWNCCFRTMDDISAFSEAFYWLLLGAGVGFSVEEKHISKLPLFHTHVEIKHEPYSFNGTRYPHTTFEYDGGYLFGAEMTIEDLQIEDSVFFARHLKNNPRKVRIKVGDSKEGWCNAVRLLLSLLTLPTVSEINFNYNNVRPKGEPIKTFGGRASGHQNIQDILQTVYGIICRSGGRLRSIDVLDATNSIGLGVVSGGVRRTAIIVLGDEKDTAFIEAKENLWTDESKADVRSIRVMSNNSVVYYENPGLEEIQKVVERIKTNGEPGFSLVGNAQKHDPNIAGFNPCFTGDMRLLTTEGYQSFASLSGKEIQIINAEGSLSLSRVWCSGEKTTIELQTACGNKIKCTPDHVWMTLNGAKEAKDCLGEQLVSFDEGSKEEFAVTSVKPNGTELVYDFTEPLIHWGVVEGFVAHNCHEAALANKQSCNLTTQNLLAHVQDGNLNYPLLEQTLQLITRIGCRQTLAKQWHPEWDKVQKRDRLLGVSMTGVEDAFDILQLSQEEKEKFFRWAAHIVRKEADAYNARLGIPRSMRVSLVKPEGTLSQLPTVSSGIGKAYAPEYYRRVRFSRIDPLAIALQQLGIPVAPENNQGNDLFDEQCNTWVFTFPIKTNATTRAIDEPVESQFKRYLQAQCNYVKDGHNASNTMTVAPDEWNLVAQLIHQHWDDVIGVTFLPRFDPREGGKASYPNMPYEPCEKEEYDNLKTSMPLLTENRLIEIVAQYERSSEEQEIENNCDSGACPIR